MSNNVQLYRELKGFKNPVRNPTGFRVAGDRTQRPGYGDTPKSWLAHDRPGLAPALHVCIVPDPHDIREKRAARANATPEQRAREAERRRRKRQEAKLDASRSGT